jgi:hypothetical protein
MNDLETQFDELVAREPGGDADAVFAGATRALARRDRRRRAALAGGVGAVVVAAVLVAVRIGQNDETTTTAAAARVIAADDGSIAVSLTMPERLVAGERVWAELEVRNISDRPLWWQAGGRTPPVAASLFRGPVPETTQEPEAPEESEPRSAEVTTIPEPREWSGSPADLASSLVDPADRYEFMEEHLIGLLAVGRTADSVFKALAPGEMQRFRVAADIRIPPNGVTSLTAYVSATFYDENPFVDGSAGTVGSQHLVRAEADIPVSPVPDDSSSALAAFADDPRLMAFIDDTRVENGGWYAVLGWWRGAWELTVTPRFGDDNRGQSRYRLRWRDGAIVDARRIWWDQAPADDPEGAHFPGAPPDEVDER